MNCLDYTIQKQGSSVKVNGRGLFSKDEVSVLLSKTDNQEETSFIVQKNNNSKKIIPSLTNVINANRNTVLSNGTESICLVEHFLGACSLLGIKNIKVMTNANELVLGDGSARHWYEAFKLLNLVSDVKPERGLIKPVLVKQDGKQIAAIPHDGFKVSYYMEWDHPALGQLFASWEKKDNVEKILRARTFGTREENDFFKVSDVLLTLEEKNFNKKLHEPLEPLYHKILDIIGDLSLSGINPLVVNMHVIGFKSGHSLNIELAEKLLDNLN